jgi:hypothetical protein
VKVPVSQDDFATVDTEILSVFAEDIAELQFHLSKAPPRQAAVKLLAGFQSSAALVGLPGLSKLAEPVLSTNSSASPVAFNAALAQFRDELQELQLQLSSAVGSSASSVAAVRRPWWRLW